MSLAFATQRCGTLAVRGEMTLELDCLPILRAPPQFDTNDVTIDMAKANVSAGPQYAAMRDGVAIARRCKEIVDFEFTVTDHDAVAGRMAVDRLAAAPL